MKKLLAIMMGLMICFAFGSNVLADFDNGATTTVALEVKPNISVASKAGFFSMGTVQTGIFTYTIPFRVDANEQTIDMYVEVTDLYKADDANNSDVAPIPVAEGQMPLGGDAEFGAEFGNPTGGASSEVLYEAGYTGEVNQVPARKSEQLEWESSQSGHFSQDIAVTVAWDQDDPEKPQGQYSGFVRLNCALLQ